jgi:hypothetical protein
VRELPAPEQVGDFLPVAAGAGTYHHIRLAGASLLAVTGMLAAVLAWPGGGILPLLAALAGTLLALSAAGYLAGTLLPFSRFAPRLWLRRFAMAGDRLLLRNLLRVARLVGDKTDPILRSFVQANNAAVRALYRRRKPDNVMILLPHCVIWTRCPKKVVKDLARCTDCDLCQMEEILGLSDRASLPVGIAIRSTEAYTQARGMGPDLTLAVACDDRLVKGITRVPELPAFGLPLHLPKEACHDNLVDLRGLQEAVAYFLGDAKQHGDARRRASLPAPASPRIRLPALASAPTGVGAESAGSA